MGKKRLPVGPTILPDGHYWYKNFINLRGGGHVDRWKLARIVGGKVQQFGSDAVIDQDCAYLRHALWVRISEPPGDDSAHTTVIQPATERQRLRCAGRVAPDDWRGSSARIRLIAEGIVDTFLAIHDSTKGYYARHPEHKAELVAQVARLIASVRE